MIKTIQVTNFIGESLDLVLARPNASGIIVTDVTGLGAVNADINVTDLATSDGGHFNSARVGTRNIVLTLKFMEKPTIEDVRHLTYRMFPIKRMLTLKIETDTRTCYIDGYVEKNDPTIFSKSEGTQISIICPDPYFYSGIQTTDFVEITKNFEYPFEKPEDSEEDLIFGVIDIKTVGVISYEGDTEVGVTIKIHALGPVENLTVFNMDTGQSMFIDTNKIANMTGSGIIKSDTITICTVRGKKRITLKRNDQEYNILSALEKGATWFTLQKGDNVFTFSAESGTENVQFQIQNRILYEGV